MFGFALNYEDVIGYAIDGEAVCHDCIKHKEYIKISDLDLILDEETDEEIFCSRCCEMLNGDRQRFQF